MKNINNNKCFLYSYIRKFKNIVTSNPSRISKKDLEIAKEIIDECNIDFENVALDGMDGIEKLLKVHSYFWVLQKI